MSITVSIEGYDVTKYVLKCSGYSATSNATSGRLQLPNIQLSITLDCLNTFGNAEGKSVYIDYGKRNITGKISSAKIQGGQGLIEVETDIISAFKNVALLSAVSYAPSELILQLLQGYEDYINEFDFSHYGDYEKALGLYMQGYVMAQDNRTILDIVNNVVDKSGALVGIEGNKLIQPIPKDMDITIIPASPIGDSQQSMYYFGGYSVDYFGSGGYPVQYQGLPMWQSSGGVNSNIQYMGQQSATAAGLRKLVNFPQSKIFKFKFLDKYPLQIFGVYCIDNDTLSSAMLIDYTIEGGFVNATFREA